MRRWLVALLLGWACCAAATEQRVALVIGNAGYRVDPLDNPVNDARLVAASLKQAGFNVMLAENLDRRGLLGAMRAFGQRLNEQTVAVLYYAGHGLQLRDRNYLIPVDAEIRSEDEIPIAGVDVGFLLGRMATARSRTNLVILDACRNNPFATKGGNTAQGLAPMDAPVGTLLAFATAPGKLAADSGGGVNSLYAASFAQHLLSPGLPVEHVFKRVREAVVRATAQAQVPWESSSLQGEFSFVESAATLAARDAAPRVDASTPMLAAVTPPRNDSLPRVGDSWRYRVQDQFRLGDLFLTARVDAVGPEGVAETWTTTSDAKLRTTVVSLDPGFSALPGWNLTPPEFSPYLLAAGGLRRGLPMAEQRRVVEQLTLPLHASVEGEEEVEVTAGRFRATKLVLRGLASPRGAARSAAVTTEHVVWYAPAVRRMVKYTVSTGVGTSLREATTFELTEFKLN